MTRHRPPNSNRPEVRRKRARWDGQALVEFALVLPILLLVVGATLDLARVYQSWITLDAATRDAAEYVASKSTTSGEAASAARKTVCVQAQRLPGFAAGATTATCTNPTVTVSSFVLSTSGGAASTRNPVASATVQTSLPFRTLFAYPLMTSDGVWTLQASASYTVIQNR